MSANEQPRPENLDIKKEIQATPPADTNLHKADNQYLREVSMYFSTIRKELPELVEDDSEYGDYLGEVEGELKPLFMNGKLDQARLHPEWVGMGLGELAGVMGKNNPDMFQNVSEDPKENEKRETQYLATKKLFMSTCAKLFPDTQANINTLPLIIEKLEKSTDFMSETGRLSLLVNNIDESDPAQIASEIDGILMAGGNTMHTIGFEKVFTAESNEEREKNEKILANAGEALYMLQLIRDELRKKTYGREDITPSETKEIDAIRKEIGQPTKTEETPEKKLMGKISVFKNQLERNFGRSLLTFGWPDVGTDLPKLQQLADGLAKINSAWMRDTDLPHKKTAKFETQTKELFDSLR